MDRPVDIVTLGHAIVDVLAPSPDELPSAYGMEKGTMTLVDEQRAQELYRVIGPAVESSGGSAANTAAGIANLGGSVAFMGKVRNDQLGKVFTHDIRNAGVAFDVPASADGPATGLCMVMVHSDAQRTMATYLGAGGHLYPDDVDANRCIEAKIVYVEGYLVGLRETEWTVSKAAAACHLKGGRFALSLSDPYWVDLKAAALGALLDDVDILFGNEEEVMAMTGACLDDALAELAHRCDIVVVTRGKLGSLVASRGQVIEVEAHPADVIVDTTGAGDLYASGFLYGLINDLDVDACAELASLTAAEVLGHLGARPQTSLRQLAVDAGLLA
ncbi:MAG TPA: adenosine kinase [Acidimicrobiales bacterium]|jgi:sugar/nucleoside kinase (ribokinase family)|nr:adenosine kinase [Acidimicrobiales bacterium]